MTVKEENSAESDVQGEVSGREILERLKAAGITYVEIDYDTAADGGPIGDIWYDDGMLEDLQAIKVAGEVTNNQENLANLLEAFARKAVEQEFGPFGNGYGEIKIDVEDENERGFSHIDRSWRWVSLNLD